MMAHLVVVVSKSPSHDSCSHIHEKVTHIVIIIAQIDEANFRPMGCYTALLVFFTDYSSRMFISQFLANKITEIELEVCEKAKFRAPFCGC